jgi:N-acetylneuraminic acid mutarotase
MGYESLPLLNMNVLYHCMVLEQNKIYIIGGQSYFNFKYSWQKNVYVFDIAKNKWSIKTPIPMPISGGEAFVLNNKIHVIGGKDTYGNDNSGLKDSHYVYDIKKNVWDIAEKIPYRVFGHQLVHVNGKNILIGGVTNSPNPTNKVISF